MLDTKLSYCRIFAAKTVVHDCSMCTVMVNEMVGLLAKMARQGKRVLWVFIATLVAIAFPFSVFLSVSCYHTR